MSEVKVSVVIPCLDEEETIGSCIEKSKQVFAQEGINGEVVVVDNGSKDRSAEIAKSLGAMVVVQPVKGYGAAYLKGIEASRGEYIVMGDGDDTYDFREMPELIKTLDQGYDFAIGSRFMGKMKKGAMSFTHRYIGNPILTAVLNVFFKSKVSDAHSGFRALKKEILQKLQLKTLGMEFASEMIVSALREKVRIKEVPITYYPRKGISKLDPIADAWRHMRFMLLFSPDWLFMLPGLSLFLIGFVALLLASMGKLIFLGHRFDVHAMIFFSFFSFLGFQIVNLGVFAKTYSLLEGFVKKDFLLEKIWKMFRLEKGILAGLILFIVGLAAGTYVFLVWVITGFGELNQARLGLLGVFFMILGIQIIFSSFFLSLLGIPKINTSR